MGENGNAREGELEDSREWWARWCGVVPEKARVGGSHGDRRGQGGRSRVGGGSVETAKVRAHITEAMRARPSKKRGVISSECCQEVENINVSPWLGTGEVMGGRFQWSSRARHQTAGVR